MRFGGSGGQGVIFAALVLGRAAVLDGKNVLQTQAYGAEARGSLSKSEVIISDDIIGFPAVRKSDILVTMSQDATNELLKDLKETGTLLVDSTSVRDVPPTTAKILRFPATEVAKRIFGDGLYANMIMLGALLQVSGLVAAGSMEEAIRESTAKKNLETNLEAFRDGLKLQPTQ
ncbi:MAG TPA: 2-oxoacid:acceptor oxidoreductase family protein [Nitrososphaerales archaeon]|nr:2-oxoacid:acceptor oxidoreductase family protein [Nitrososphaerales archaeon]